MPVRTRLVEATSFYSPCNDMVLACGPLFDEPFKLSELTQAIDIPMLGSAFKSEWSEITKWIYLPSSPGFAVASQKDSNVSLPSLRKTLVDVRDR